MVALLLLDGHARRQVDQERVFRDRSRPLDYLINQELLENCRCDIPLCHAIILFAKLLVPPPLSRMASDQIQSGPDRGSDRKMVAEMGVSNPGRRGQLGRGQPFLAFAKFQKNCFQNKQFLANF